MYILFIGNLDIVPFISESDVVSINKMTVILTMIGQYEVKDIMTLQNKNNNILIYILPLLSQFVLLDSLRY